MSTVKLTVVCALITKRASEMQTTTIAPISVASQCLSTVFDATRVPMIPAMPKANNIETIMPSSSPPAVARIGLR